MRRAALLLIASLNLLFLIGLASPVGATVPAYDWICYFDFTSSDQGFTFQEYYGVDRMGTWQAGQGWKDGYGHGFAGAAIYSGLLRASGAVNFKGFEIHSTTSRPGTLTGADVHWVQIGGLVAWSLNIGTPMPNTLTYEFTGPGITGNSISLNLWAWGGTDSGDIVVHDLKIWGTGTGPDECPGLGPDASYVAMPFTGEAPLTVEFTNTSVRADTYLWDFGDGNTSTAFNVTKVYDVPGLYTATLTATRDGVDDTYSEVIEVIDEGDFYKPLSISDADTSLLYPPGQDGLFDLVYAEQAADAYGGFQPGTVDFFGWIQSLRDFYERVTGGPGWQDSTPEVEASLYNSLTVISNTPNRPVHAVVGGTVLSIETFQDCDNTRCIFVIPIGLTGLTSNIILRAEMAGASIVTVSLGDREVRYVVSNPQLSIGDEIEAGCIVGYTMSVTKLNNWEMQSVQTEVGGQSDENGNLSVSASLGAGWTITSKKVAYGVSFMKLISADGSVAPLLEELTQDPTSLTPCNIDPAHKTCQGDASLTDPTLWQKKGGVVWNVGDKPALSTGGSIVEQLALSSGVSYSMTVQARRSGTNGTITMQIGTTTQTFPMTAQIGSYTIESAVHTADAGLYYSVAVLNAGAGAIDIMGVCVAEAGAGEQQPNVCVFENPSLDTDAAKWTKSAGVSSGFSSGEIIMPDESTIAQQIKLYPNGASTYEYVVQVRATVFGEGWESETASTVGFEWSFNGGGYTAISDPGGFTSGTSFASFKTTAPYTATRRAGNELVYEVHVPISAAATGPFVIRAQVSLAGSFSGGLLVREICITNPFAESDQTGGGGLPFPTNCEMIAPPTDESISSWLYWHWSNLDRFYQCDLMTLLNKMYKLGYDSLTFTRWQLRYWQSVLVLYSNWLGNRLMPYLNGHFSNMARAGGITVNQAAGTNFWDALIAVIKHILAPLTSLFTDIVGKVFNLLIDIIRRIFDLVFDIITKIFDLLWQMISVIKALTTAWNTANPADVGFLPHCDIDPQTPACIPGWVAENTIFSGLGAVIVPLITSIMVIDLLLWLLIAVSNAITGAGQVS